MARWLWQRVFSTICWLLWKNRCRWAMEGKADNPKQIVHKCSYHLFEDVQNGSFYHQLFTAPERGFVHWQPPDPGYVRVDVDGSRDSRGSAACGGVIRDYQGIWLCGFQQKLGHNNSVAAEIHAIHSRLQICKQLGFTRIRLFSDSLQAIQLLFIDSGMDHPLFDVISATRSLIYRDWDLVIAHTHRENIRCADFLARNAHLSNQEFLAMATAPLECNELFVLECGGIPQQQ